MILEELDCLIEANKLSNKAKSTVNKVTSAISKMDMSRLNRILPQTPSVDATAKWSNLRADSPTASNANPMPNAVANSKGVVGDIVDKIKTSRTARYAAGTGAGALGAGYLYNRYQNAKEKAGASKDTVLTISDNLSNNKGKLALGAAALGGAAYLHNKRK